LETMTIDEFFQILNPMILLLGLVSLAVIVLMIIERRRERAEREAR